MTHTALIRFAPLQTLERVNDDRWKNRGRTMYLPGGLTFVPSRDSAKLLVNHDHEREIGVVRSLVRWDDHTGPWLAAIAEISKLPSWLRKGDTKASFSYMPMGSYEAWGCHMQRRGLVTEVSVLSPDREPAEPLAQVLSLHPTEAERASSPAAALTSNRAVAGEPVLTGTIRRQLGEVLRVR